MEYIDQGLFCLFYYGDKFRITAPITNLVALALKIIAPVANFFLQPHPTSYRDGLCFNYLKGKTYTQTALLVLPLLGFNIVKGTEEKHDLFNENIITSYPRFLEIWTFNAYKESLNTNFRLKSKLLPVFQEKYEGENWGNLSQDGIKERMQLSGYIFPEELLLIKFSFSKFGSNDLLFKDVENIKFFGKLLKADHSLFERYKKQFEKETFVSALYDVLDEDFKINPKLCIKFMKMNKKLINVIFNEINDQQQKEVFFQGILTEISAIRTTDKKGSDLVDVVIKKMISIDCDLFFQNVEKLIQENKICIKTRQDDLPLSYLIYDLKNDRKASLSYVYEKSQVFKYINEDFKKDEEFVLECLKHHFSVYERISKSLKEIETFSMKALTANSSVWDYLDASFKTTTFAIDLLQNDSYSVNNMYAIWSFEFLEQILLETIQREPLQQLKVLKKMPYKDTTEMLTLLKSLIEKVSIPKMSDEEFKQWKLDNTDFYRCQVRGEKIDVPDLKASQAKNLTGIFYGYTETGDWIKNYCYALGRQIYPFVCDRLKKDWDFNQEIMDFDPTIWEKNLMDPSLKNQKFVLACFDRWKKYDKLEVRLSQVIKFPSEEDKELIFRCVNTFMLSEKLELLPLNSCNGGYRDIGPNNIQKSCSYLIHRVMKDHKSIKDWVEKVPQCFQFVDFDFFNSKWEDHIFCSLNSKHSLKKFLLELVEAQPKCLEYASKKIFWDEEILLGDKGLLNLKEVQKNQNFLVRLAQTDRQIFSKFKEGPLSDAMKGIEILLRLNKRMNARHKLPPVLIRKIFAMMLGDPKEFTTLANKITEKPLENKITEED